MNCRKYKFYILLPSLKISKLLIFIDNFFQKSNVKDYNVKCQYTDGQLKFSGLSGEQSEFPNIVSIKN